MSKNLLGAMAAADGITATDIIGRIDGTFGHDVVTAASPPCRRAMFMGRQCMAFECMRQAISGCGLEADFCSIEDPITKQACEYDVFVMFLAKYAPGMPALIQQRISELRACMPQIPTMALLEDAHADAAMLYHLGFSTIIMGLPSLNFAVTAIRLLSLAGKAAATIYAVPARPEAQERRSLDPDQAGNDLDAMLADVSFTNRELDLIDLLRSGMQNKLMAHRLGISESTVKAHLRNIMTKLHAKNRTQAIFMLSKDMMRRAVIDGGQRS
jgi:DNA-binding NarL/FixJ family response regulator